MSRATGLSRRTGAESEIPSVNDSHNHGANRASGDGPRNSEDESENAGADSEYEELVATPAEGTVLQCILCITCGVIFGIAMEKGRIFEPKLIRSQMILSKFVMLKMFLSAMATGMFGMSLLAMMSGTNRKFMMTCNGYYNSLVEKGVLSSIVGGLMLGVGMVFAGSCPTSIFTQLGALLPNSGYTLAGALVGTLVYGLFKPVFDTVLRPSIRESSNPWAHSPYFVMSVPLVAMFGVLVCAFEILLPWTTEVQLKNPLAPWYARKAWPPYVSGIIIGSLQVPLILGINETLGGSSSFITLLSQVFVGPLKRLSPFICKYRTGFQSWWQIFYVSGVVLGAYLSASSSGALGSAKGVPADHAFIGGLLMILGARIAGGCTSGHGLSGMGFLSIVSFLTVACMFLGAVPTAYIMRRYGMLRIV